MIGLGRTEWAPLFHETIEGEIGTAGDDGTQNIFRDTEELFDDVTKVSPQTAEIPVNTNVRTRKKVLSVFNDVPEQSHCSAIVINARGIDELRGKSVNANYRHMYSILFSPSLCEDELAIKYVFGDAPQIFKKMSKCDSVCTPQCSYYRIPEDSVLTCQEGDEMME
jgi:hypothetical protein